jgi:hypothetical protein
MFFRRFAVSSLLVLLAVFAKSSSAQSATWAIEQPDVRVVCPMTVGGSFEARTKSLTGALTATGEGGAFDGRIAVDLRTLDTGIDLRTHHLREHLEVGKGDGFDTAVLSGITLSSMEGRATFSGMLQLHGTARPLNGAADVQHRRGVLRIDATFPVRLSDFAIAEPRYMGIGVKDVVQVKVSFVATPMEGEES